MPDPVESLKLVKLSSRAFQISFSSPFDGNSPIKRYVIQYKTSQGILIFFFKSNSKSNNSYHLKKKENWQSAKEISLESTRNEAFVRNLAPMTDYELRMAAVNDIGQSKWSDLLSITTEEEGTEIHFELVFF